jgi:aryl-phospho-beta-D-glucosidase BglC (GH1 family)
MWTSRFPHTFGLNTSLSIHNIHDLAGLLDCQQLSMSSIVAKLTMALGICATAKLALAAPVTAPSTTYVNWKTAKFNGVNLGGWLNQESTIDTDWWAKYSGGSPDEAGLCAHLGSRCGPVLERRYSTWITTSTIDELACHGVNLLRIATTYAAWVKVPGDQHYSGNQQSYLKKIATYAINKYDMHVSHSRDLPTVLETSRSLTRSLQIIIDIHR